ncbi:MAG: hypothetical protein AUI54_00270 [Acidobacteria bacterium 13_1_40CM_2_56_5]|nr:MAG: hypothetical protein AUI54_00270 [Acidobacteria bacterium 13_1_40CM_2_56_5]
MIFNDLRDYIATLEKLGQLKIIEGASCDLEIGAITEIASFRKTCPAVLFDSIKGFKKGYRVLTNVVSTRLRERIVFGVSNDLTDPEAVRSLETPKTMRSLSRVDTISLAEVASAGRWPLHLRDLICNQGS